MTYEWIVNSYGDLICPSVRYEIPAERLREDGWITHMLEKRWVDKATFLEAFKKACRIAGVDEVRVGYSGEKIKINDIKL